jgi:thiamine pyrophosphate-dependent acetolactate synthase large subunit-like protein
MKVHEAMARAITESGVTHVFGVMGDGNMHVISGLAQQGVTYVGATREDAAVLMANGYSRASGRVGVATVTHGPALTHTVTALVEGVRSRNSTVVIAADTPAGAPFHQQRIDQHAVVLPTGAGFQQVHSAATALDDLAAAFRRALDEHRPIVLNAPVDIQMQETEHRSGWVAVPPQRVQADPEALDRALGVIASARRPVVVAGWGAVVSGARDAVLELARRIGAPVATTLLAKDWFRGEPDNLGVCGTVASPRALEVLVEADCVVAVGASLSRYTSAQGSLFSGKHVVQVDLDPVRIGATTAVDVAVAGDALATVRSMLVLLDALGPEPAAAWACPTPERPWDEPDAIADHSGTTTVDIRTAAARLEALLPAQRSLVIDGGRFIYAPLAYFHVPEPQAFVWPTGFGSIGLSLSTAIGVALARPDAPVVVAAGDGGLMASLLELNTAVRYGLDVIVVAFDDGGYGAEYRNLLREGMKPDLALFDWPDLAGLARALGAEAITVSDVEGFDAVGPFLSARRRPALVHVRIDPAAPTGY